MLTGINKISTVVLILLTALSQLKAQNSLIKHGESSKLTHIKDYGLKEYIYLSKELPHSENQPWKLVCQMPYNCQFQPWIQIKSKENNVISLNSSNPLVLYLTKTEKVTTQPGIHSYEAKNWVSGEGAIYTIPAGVTVEAVKYRETGFNTTFAGYFECDDNDYNILWKKGARTGYICMRDHFYDCPDRERVGFWGDGTTELDQCFYAFDTASYLLCKDLVLRPLEAGFYPGRNSSFLVNMDYGFTICIQETLHPLLQFMSPLKTSCLIPISPVRKISGSIGEKK